MSAMASRCSSGVERSLRKRNVVGSNPTSGSFLFLWYYLFPTIRLVRFSPMPFCMAIHAEHIALLDFISYLFNTGCPCNYTGYSKALFRPIPMVKLEYGW